MNLPRKTHLQNATRILRPLPGQPDRGSPVPVCRIGVFPNETYRVTNVLADVTCGACLLVLEQARREMNS